MNFVKRNWYWILPVVVAVAYLVFTEVILKKAQKKALTGGGYDGSGISAVGLDMKTVLYEGIKHKDLEIKYLQSWLNSHGGNPQLVVDGFFGKKTAQALYSKTKKWNIALKDLPKN